MLFDVNIAHAQTFSKVGANPAVNTLVTKIVSYIVTPLIQGLFIFAGLIFVYGVVEMIVGAADSGAREKGQQHILWGVVGMFIMVSAYGIVRFIANTVGVGDPFL